MIISDQVFFFLIIFYFFSKMSYTRQLLYSFADNLGRNRKEMDPYVNVLQKNWYDTKESLQTLSLNDYDKFDIPRRLSSMIIEKVGSKQQTQQQSYQPQQYNQQYNQNQNQNQQQYRPQQSHEMQPQFSLPRTLQKLKKKCNKQKFQQLIDVMTRLFRNVRQNLTQQKFRILKKSNAKIAQLISSKEICQVLNYGGFQDNKDTIYMRNVNIGRIDDCIQALMVHNSANKFDPYKSQITNISGNKGNMQGETSVVYNDKLKQLQKQRQQIMSRPIRDRDVKIFKQVGQQIKPDANWNDERQLNQQQKLYAQSIKQKLKSYGQDPKFMNRRKQQYFQLMKKPCFSQTLVRVKLPDNWIFQCKFSPLQTLGDLVKIFAEYVQDKNLNYYLYMTPPVEKLNGLILRQTFYERGCVPRAIFYFGSDAKINGNILRQKKTGGFGFFN